MYLCLSFSTKKKGIIFKKYRQWKQENTSITWPRKQLNLSKFKKLNAT